MKLFSNCLVDPLVPDHLIFELASEGFHAFADEIFAANRTWRLKQSADVCHFPFRKPIVERAALRSVSSLNNEFVQAFLIVAAGFGHTRNFRSIRHLHHPLFKFLESL